MRALCWIIRLLGFGCMVVGLLKGDTELVIFAAGPACCPILPESDFRRRWGVPINRQTGARPLRFYRGMDGKVHFYRKVSAVRLAQLEREVGLREPYEAERAKAINKVRKATTRDIDSWSGVLQAFAAVYRVPLACDGAASGKETARNRSCVECNDYVVLPPGWGLKHYSAMEYYSDSNPPPLPVLTEPRDTL